MSKLRYGPAGSHFSGTMPSWPQSRQRARAQRHCMDGWMNKRLVKFGTAASAAAAPPPAAAAATPLSGPNAINCGVVQPAALSLSLPYLVRLQARLSRGAGTPVRIVINRPGPSPRQVPPPPRRLSTDLPPVEPERRSPWTPRNPESLRQQANFGPWWWSSWWEFLPNFAPAARTFRS
ncbi:hypothetical protein Purlil1_6784 [Purpureocillium lilacinum]|uniref:Uncharacterized protein n=1 Tax=Purpureocillium lilacinum TaxID=33203 RepID=A0ABR0BXY9_PURLI|nr:hypothetical protein Purlil1_6784 [Purpureocillium lilacinum]